MARVAPQKIDGLTFAVDRKTVDKVVVTTGKNFIVDLDGPRSAFAHNRSGRPTSFNSLPESFTIGLETFHFLRDTATNTFGVFRFNWVKRQWELILDFAMNPVYADYKTTFALVGGLQYFANRAWGIWERNPTTDVWTDVSANFPNNVFYITESAGRCIAVADGIVAWSALDNANDFTPSTVTGSGFQSLSLIGFPENDSDYRGLKKVADGFLVFMRQGILKSTSINNIIQFRHRVIKSKIIALNPWCFAEFEDDNIVFLTAQGFYVTNGQDFEIWQPLLSEELKLKIIPTLIQDKIGQIQVHYSKEKNWFFVSITDDSSSKLFEKAFVSYLPRGEWGVFNDLHKGFIDIDIVGDGSGFQQDQLAYITAGGEVALFQDNVNHVEIAATSDTSASDIQNIVYYSDEVYDIPNVIKGLTPDTLFANCSQIMSADWFVFDRLIVEHISLPIVPSFYEVNGLQQHLIDTDIPNDAYKFYDDVNSIAISQQTNIRDEALVYGHLKQDFAFISLNTQITIGLFRLTDEQQSDQLSLLTNVAISMTDIDTASSVFEDWLNDFTPDLTVDWLNGFTPDEFEDWGLNAANTSSYSASVFGSLDGYKEFENNKIVLDLAKTSGRTRFYSTSIQGLYILIDIDGTKVNDYIHLKHIELTGILAGRL